MVDRLRILVESRIPGDRYVRFGGEYMETYYSNIERRWVLSLLFGQAGYKQPRTAWSPALFPTTRLVRDPSILRDDKKMRGLIYGLFYPSLKRIGHCGITERLQGDLVFGIEANTSLAGSREGDGVYRKIRHKRTIYCYADWVK